MYEILQSIFIMFVVCYIIVKTVVFSGDVYFYLQRKYKEGILIPWIAGLSVFAIIVKIAYPQL